MRTFRGIVVLICTNLLVSCGDSQRSQPTAPTTTAALPPADALFIKGTVYDTAYRIVVDARVEVLDGPQVGLATTSDSRGYFTLVGAFDDSTSFQASKAGYTVGIEKLQPFCERCNPQRWVHFALDVPGEPAVVSGNYDVTFAVDPTCGGFPIELRRRTFAATIPYSRGYFEVLLSGGTFSGYLGGGVSGHYIGFYMEGFAEQVSPNSFLIYNMGPTATIESSPLVIDAAGGGSVTYCQLLTATGSVDDCYRQVASIYNVCQRENHRLTFTRR